MTTAGTDANARLQHARMDLVRKAKERPCADCGVQYPYYVMDPDHRPGEKKLFNLGHAYKYPFKAIVAELAKCDIVCSNCHRERTHRRQAAPRRQAPKPVRVGRPDGIPQSIIDAVKASDLGCNAAAREFGISPSSVSLIRSGKRRVRSRLLFQEALDAVQP